MKPRITSLHVKPVAPERRFVERMAIWKGSNGEVGFTLVDSEDGFLHLPTNRMHFMSRGGYYWQLDLGPSNTKAEWMLRVSIYGRFLLFPSRFMAQTACKQFHFSESKIEIWP